MASFFYCGRLSSAQLVPLQALTERHQRQWIINPSLQICAWNRSWIKGLGKNPFTPFCPGAPKRVCHSHEWRVDTASGKTLKKTECVFTRSPTGGRKKNCVYTRPPKRRIHFSKIYICVPFSHYVLKYKQKFRPTLCLDIVLNIDHGKIYTFS